MARILSRRRIWPLLALVLVGNGNSMATPGDRPSYTYRANVNEVRIRFSAVDQNNHGVATLQPSDFAVVDKDFIVRNFQSFTRSDWTKVEIAILIDASDSVTRQFRQEIASTLDLVSRSAGIPDENLSIMSFRDSHPDLLCAGNCRATDAAARLPATHAGGLTPLFDSIVFASQFLTKHSDGQSEKALIVFSDGNDTISRNSLSDAVDAAQAADIELYCVNVDPRIASQGTRVLHLLADATGARYFAAPTGPIRALDAILEDFRASYTVTYQLPSHAAGFHLVRVLPTHNLNLHFRSRSGYYYPDHLR